MRTLDRGPGARSLANLRPWLAPCLAIALFIPTTAIADPTPITVRVLARDGKFIGAAMGGVQVVVRDTETGRILAEGTTHGGTGDTDVLVLRPRERHGQLTRDGDARFDAVLEIERPQRVTVEVRGPLAMRQSEAMASSTQWVLPGLRPHGPDGWVMELGGLAVDVITPTVYDRSVRPGGVISVSANVMLLCGCGLEPGRTWDASQYQIRYTATLNGEPLSEGPLTYAGAPSRFEASVPSARSGVYELVVTAYDPVTGNAGTDRASVVVQ